MKKNLISISIILSLFSYSHGQNGSGNIRRNSIYLELGGQGLFYSFSFERLTRLNNRVLTPTNICGAVTKVKTAYSIGITSSFPDGHEYLFAVPTSYNFLWGKINNHLELGAGFTAFFHRYYFPVGASDSNIPTDSHLFNAHKNEYHILLTSRIGYRFQKQQGGVFFRMAFTPFFAGLNSMDDGVSGGEGQNKIYNFKLRHLEFFKNTYPISQSKISASFGISIGYTLKK